MALSLTSAESLFVEPRRKTPKPSYYAASSKRYVQISDDMEAFIILMGEDLRLETMEWLKNANTIAVTNKERDDLLKLALEDETNDVRNRKNEVNESLGSFNQWRDKFTAGKFSSVTEIGVVLGDMQRSIGELVALEDRMFHLTTILKLLKERFELAGVTEDVKKEMESLNRVFAAY